MVADMRMLKRINRAQVLALLRDGRTLPRVRMKEATGLNGTTITNVTRDLMKRGLLRSRGLELSTGGRRPELLALNADWKYTLGIYLGPGRIYGVLVNLFGQTKDAERTAVEPAASEREILAAIEQVCLSLSRRVAPSRILGAGMAGPGVFDSHRAVVVQSVAYPALAGIDLRQWLGSCVGKPVDLDISTRCMALAERRFGAAKGLQNFIHLEIGMGIGCAIVSEGKLHRGLGVSAGELGHTMAVEGGRGCPCGNQGCLETVASVGALVRDARKALGKTSLTFDNIVSMCHEGDGDVAALVHRVGRHIGLSLSRLIGVFSSSHVIVGGDLTRLGTPLLDSINAALEEYSLPAVHHAVKLIGAEFGEDAGAALGATTLIIDKVFDAHPRTTKHT